MLRAATTARFAAHDVAPGQLLYEGHTTGEAYEEAFARVDLALDPSPCPGGTTTLEAASRGVPVLTLKGADYYARIGVQIALGLGMPDLVAESWDDYVSRAVALAGDPAALDDLRSRVISGMQTAPFSDEPLMARKLEQAYRELFTRWCVAQPKAA